MAEREMSLSTSLTKVELVSLDEALQKAEFENCQQLKTIETEKENIIVLQLQVEETVQKTKELEIFVNALDEQAKRLHKSFRLNRDNAESLRHTLSVLDQHAGALQEKLQASIQITQQRRLAQAQEIDKYKTIWLRYEEKYESSTKAKCLRTFLANLEAASERSLSLEHGIEQKKQKLQDCNQRAWISYVIKIATLRTEAQHYMVLMERNSTDIKAAEGAIKLLQEKLATRKETAANRMEVAESIGSTTPIHHNVSISGSASQQNTRPSIVAIPKQTIILNNVDNRVKVYPNISRIPKVSVEIKQLTLPPLTPVKNQSKGYNKPAGEAISSSDLLVQATAQTKSNHQSINVPPFTTKSSVLPLLTPVCNVDSQKMFTLNVPLRQNRGQVKVAGMLSNPASALSSITINSATHPQYPVVGSGFDSSLTPNCDALKENYIHSYEMQNRDLNAMDDYNSTQSTIMQVSSDPSEHSPSVSGTWFDTWSVENSVCNQQPLFSNQPLIAQTNHGFQDGFLGKETGGFPFLSSQDHPMSSSASLFCEANSSPLPSEGFALSCPFTLSSSNQSAQSMFNF